jgi:hypothetical protein
MVTINSTIIPTIILLTILNLLDYILTLLNRGNFEETNPIICKTNT